MVPYISATVAHNRNLSGWLRTDLTLSRLISDRLIEHASQGTVQNITGCFGSINSYGRTYSRLVYSTRCKSGTYDTFSLCSTRVHTRLEPVPRFLRTCDVQFDCIEVVRRLTFCPNIKGRFTHSMPRPCRSHAFPLPCRAVPLIHTCHAAPLPCSDSAVSFVKVHVVAGNIRTASQQF
jgi:hypothetical protein